MKKFIKIFSIIFAFAFVLTLYGCGENFDKFLLHFSSPSIELSLGETKQYQFEIENYVESSLNFDYSFDKDIAKVEKTEEIESGVFQIDVTALMSGDTTLTITLLENNTSIQVPVKVYEDITSFSLKENVSLYVLRGQSITFDESMFNFYPLSTLQTQLTYTVNDQKLESNTYQTDQDTPNILNVVAQSVWNSELNVKFEVVVLDEINKNNLENTSLALYNRVSDKYEEINPIDSDNPGVITIISNDNQDYVKHLQFIFNPDYNYQYSFASKYGNISIDKDINLDFENSVNLKIQREDKAQDYYDELVIRISHNNYNNYYVELCYKVEIKMIPKSVKLNGNSNNLYYNLFDNNPSQNTKEVLISVDPVKSTFSQIDISFALVNTNGIENVVTYNALKEFICIKYKGLELSDDNNILRDASGTITFYGQKVLNDDYSSIKIIFEAKSSLTTEVISNYIEVTIQKGAKKFFVNEQYANSTIYIKKGDEQIFDGMVVEEDDAYIGEITVSCDMTTAGYSTIEQVEDNQKQLKIKGVNVGQTIYTLTLSNGISTKLKVIVKEELSIDDFMLYVSSNAENGIAKIKYKKVQGSGIQTIEAIEVAGSGVKFDISYLVKPNNVDTDMYNVVLISDDTTLVEIINNKTIRTVATAIKTTNIRVELSFQKIEDFELSSYSLNDAEYLTYNFNFTVKCFEPLSSFSILGKNDGIKDEKYTNIIDIYNDTPYIDKLMASVSLVANAISTNGKADKEIIKDIDWAFSVESTGFTESGVETSNKDQIAYYQLTELGGSIVFGNFYPQLNKFSCENSQNCDNLSFEITATINNYGQIWSSKVQINIKQYVKVTDIWLKNYTSKIYLDATNNEHIIYPYIVPSNSTNTNYTLQIIPNENSDLSSLSYRYDSESITLRYTGGKGGSGKINIIPYSSYIADGTYDYCMEIDILIGDGLTQDSALKISTWEQLKNIDLTKHYIISGIIDANNQEITPFGVLSGGIKGENGAKIQNFVIKTPNIIKTEGNYNYYGLFAIINSNAYLENITIAGSLQIENERSSIQSYVGLVAGLNKSNKISNVNAIIKSAYVKLNGDVENYVGGFCGYNEGKLEINLPCESTLLVSMPDTQIYQLELSSVSNKYYFGGVVGYNKGIINFNKNDIIINRYNDFGTIVAINLNVNVPLSSSSVDVKSCVGGIAGFNDNGTITNILIRGNIHRIGQQTYRPNYVGGIVGYSKSGTYKNITSRVFVAGYDYIAGFIGYIEYDDSLLIENCLLQALDNNKVDLDATMIVSYGGNSYNKFCNSNSPSVDAKIIGCVAETYINRTLVNVKTESLLQYYGDIVCWDGRQYTNGTKFSTNGEQSVKIFSNFYNNAMYPNNSVVLTYYNAVDIESAEINAMNSCFLPDDLFNDIILEYTIVSGNSSIISVESNGKLNIHKTGNVILTLQNKLNITDKMELNIFVTNYINSENPLELYDNSDRLEGKITKDMVLEVLNRNTIAIYPKISSLIRTMGISLAENLDVKIKIITNSDDYLTITQSKNVIYISGSGNEQSIDAQNIQFYLYYDLGNDDLRYFMDGKYIPAQEINKKIVATFDNQLEISSSFVMDYNFTLGIYDLTVDKTNITLAPMDNIDISLTYKSLSTIDSLGLIVYYVEDSFITKIETEQYFDIIRTDSFESGVYKVNFNIAMKTDNIKVGNYRFKFVNSVGNLDKTVNLLYITQPIDNIVVKNYNDINNKDMVLVDDNGKEYYNTSYAMQETNSVVAGGINILRVNATPYYANFSYIEVTNSQQNVQSGKILMFTLLKNSEIDNRKVISTDSYYTSNGIRIYKDAVLDGDITLLYKLYTNVVEGDNVDIIINFYNEDGQMVYPTYQQSYVIDINKSITVTLKNRDSNIRNNVEYIARGYSYDLDVKFVGYNADEINIVSNSPYLTILRDGNNFRMNVSQYVTYGTGEGAKASIYYYGERLVNGQKIQSSTGVVNFTIVEYVLDIISNGDNLDLNSIFDTSPLELNVKNTVKDIRTLLADKIKLEHSLSAINAVNKLKQDIIKNAYFEHQIDRNGLIFEKIETDTSYKDEYIQLDGYSVTPKRVGENIYNFRLGVKKLKYESGYIKIVIDEEDPTSMSFTQIGVNINQSISSKNYLPIRTYDEFINMKENCKYRLIDDIILNAEFTPITTNIKELDGNGYSLVLKSNYSYSNLENFGIFSEIGQDTIIKNLTIKIESYQEVNFTFENTYIAQEFNFGMFAGINNGVITNCALVVGNDISMLKVFNYAPTDKTVSSNISAFVAINNGYITNSRVTVRMEATGANLSGFVGENNGHIASSFVKESYIRNNSLDVKNSTAGFVKTNNKTILSSYVEGKYKEGNKKIYCDDSSFGVRASSIASTFTYNNKGKISDCYANMPIISSSQNSGFVGINDGLIENSYTVSRLGDNDTQNYPFFITNTSGEIENCYYLSDENFNVNVNKSNDNYDQTKLRKTSLLEFALNRVFDSQRLVITDEELFPTFVFNGNGRVNHGVWFYATNEITNNLLLDKNNIRLQIGQPLTTEQYYYLLRKVNSIEYIAMDEFSYLGNATQFVSYRPQLVSANIISYAHYELLEDESKVNEETGEIDYIYDLDGCDDLGTPTNPILIYSASELESEIYNNAKLSKNVYTKSIRIVKDIDYTQEDIVISSLYKVVFAGMLDGNGLKISGYSLNTTEPLYSAGFFSQIGYQDKETLFQNVIFEPRYINMSNVRVVGAICGTLFKADVYNVEVSSELAPNKTLVIIGKNIVGGLFGRTLNDFEIRNAKSSVSVNATNVCQQEDWTTKSAQDSIIFNEYTSNITTVAYSGTVIGYVGGFGTVQNASTNNCASVGMISGLLFGGIGLNAKVSYLEVSPIASDSCFVNASVYGGIIAGEVRGIVNYVDININEYKDDEGIIDDSYFNIFKNTNRTAQSIGAICGILRGTYYAQAENDILRNGTIDNCNVEYNINSYSDSVQAYITGGLVGKIIQNGILSNSSYSGKIISIVCVGGLVGKVELDLTQNAFVNIYNCQIGSKDNDCEIAINKPASTLFGLESISQVYIGSVIGCVSGEVAQTEKKTLILLNNIEISVVYKVKMTVYGTDDYNYIVWDFDFIGGVMTQSNLQGKFRDVANNNYIAEFENSNEINITKDYDKNYDLNNFAGEDIIVASKDTNNDVVKNKDILVI